MPFEATDFAKLIDLSNEYTNSQTVLLKRDKLNTVLLATLRALLK